LFHLAANIAIAFRVDGESALPFALPGQYVLGGHSIAGADLATMEGKCIAAKTTDGALFKRVGSPIPGAPHVRQLEAVGGLGESSLVRVEEIEDDHFAQIPLLETAFAVTGVLYDLPVD
jgi:hypothetical protein